MNNLPFYIGLGLGLAIAAGLRPFLPALLAGALGSAGDLGVSFAHTSYDFLQSSWWLTVLAAALIVSYLLQLRIGAQRFFAGPIGSALSGLSIGIGALLFAGTLDAHGKTAWPGLIAGALAAALTAATLWPIITRARGRLSDRGAREALTLYADALALLASALVALLHPLGYVLLVAVAWTALVGRRRADQKYAGLRILRR